MKRRKEGGREGKTWGMQRYCILNKDGVENILSYIILYGFHVKPVL